MIPPDDSNPYAAPTATVDVPRERGGRTQLASLGARFVGAMVDGVLYMIPGVFVFNELIALMDPANADDLPEMSAGAMAAAGIGFLVIGIVQIYLLATRSQTVGKIVAKTRIDMADGSGPAPWVNTIVLRGFVNGLIGAVPIVGAIYPLVDVLFIFRADRRCVHDLIGQTVVNVAR